MEREVRCRSKTIIVYLFWNVVIFFIYYPNCIGQQKITLESAFDLLDKQNPDLILEHLNKVKSNLDYKDAKNALLPRISFGVSNQYNFGLAFDQIAGQLITGNKWSKTANANIGLQTPVFQGFSRLNSIRMAKLNLEEQSFSFIIKKKALKLELIANYFDALTNLGLHKASKEQLILSTEQLNQVKVEFDLGTKTLIDVSLIEALVSDDELRVLSTKSNFDSRIRALKELLNISMNDSILLELPDLNVFFVKDTIGFENRNLEIALSSLNIQKSELLLKMNKKAYYPTLNFSSGYGTNYSSERRDPIKGDDIPFFNQVNQNKSLYFGISLNIPILDGLRIKSGISHAKVELDKSRIDHDKTKLVQQNIIISAIHQYQQSIEERELYKSKMASSNTSLMAMKERYKLGLSSSMDLAKTILDYNLSELNFIRSKYSVRYHQEVLNVLNHDN